MFVDFNKYLIDNPMMLVNKYWKNSFKVVNFPAFCKNITGGPKKVSSLFL